MITFWADGHGRFTINEYLLQRGAPLRDRFRVLAYDDLTGEFTCEQATHIFSALDQLTRSQFALVRSVADQIEAGAGKHVLNHPARVLFREPLLKLLAARGLNDFTVHSGRSWRSIERFPVFLRASGDHGGNLSRLLKSPGELAKAIRSLQLRGHSLSSLLVVEFCDTVDEHGYYRKYAAWRVGDAIIPNHIMISQDWMVKSTSNTPTVEAAEEELEFVEKDPHREWLRSVFDLSGITYGRIDYGVKDGRPQAWEINLNPTLQGRLGQERKQRVPDVDRIRDRTREISHGRLRQAFAALDAEAGDAPPTTVGLDPEVLAQARRELARRHRRGQVIGYLTGMSLRKWLGAPVRLVLKRLSPR